jgi:hypothetical protein
VVPDKRVISAGAAAILVLLAMATNLLGERIGRRNQRGRP